MMEVDLDKKLSAVSSKPGVYLMKNDRGKIIYIGKAGNLKKGSVHIFQTRRNWI